MKNLNALLIIMFLSSCSFNKVFLHPTAFPATTSSVKVMDIDARDTVIIHFSGKNFQPAFSNLKNQGMLKDYTIESVLFKNKKGRLLNGWLIKRTGSSTPSVTLLHLHGNEGSLANQYQSVIPLVNRDVQVFIFDYSGFGFSKGKATMKNIRNDAIAALDYILTRNDIINTQLILYGQSLGGHLAAAIAAGQQDKIDGVVIEGAFSSPKDIAAFKLRSATVPGFMGRIFVKNNYSALSAIKNYEKPLLVIHSKDDTEVPLYMGKTLYEHANVPKTFYQINGPHIDGPRLYTDSISAKIKAILHYPHSLNTSHAIRFKNN